MFLHALLADGLSQGWLKTCLQEGSTMLSNLLNGLVLALAGSSLPRMGCSFPTYVGFSSYCLCVTFLVKQELTISDLRRT